MNTIWQKVLSVGVVALPEFRSGELMSEVTVDMLGQFISLGEVLLWQWVPGGDGGSASWEDWCDDD